MKFRLFFISLSFFTVAFFTAPKAKGQWKLSRMETCAQNCFTAIGSNVFALTETNGIVFSTDSGTSWNALGNVPAPSDYFYSLVAIDSILFAGSNVGVFRSLNNGVTWDAVTSNPGSLIYDLAKGGGNGSSSILFAATDLGVFLSNDTGATWVARNAGLTDTNVHAFAIKETTAFTGTLNGIFISSDNGNGWTPINSGLTSFDIATLALIGPDILAGTFSGGVFLSINNGETWSLASNGLPLPINIVSFAVNGSTLFAGSTISFIQRVNNGIFMSTDSGANWINIGTGLTNTNVISVAAVDGYIFAATDSGIWRRPLSDFNQSRVSENAVANLGNSIQVFPNPASGIVTISIEGMPSADVEIFDVLGREVVHFQVNGSYDWETGGLPAGMYIIHANENGPGNSQPIIKRIVKE